MKITAFLLSLFFALLVAIPCNDAVSFSTNSSTSVLDKNDTSRHADSDGCSVFCNCACCAFLMTFEKMNFQLEGRKVFDKINKISDFQQNQILTVTSGIWQPPKLG